jgi:CheY-like chemotaxis protein
VSEDQPFLLIVEDDLDIAEMLNAYFHVQGYQVNTVHLGEDAVRECMAQVPDLAILDIRLPDIDGFEVAHRLRTNRRTKNIPIIFLTEKRGRSDRLQGFELGADDYLTKPFDVQELRLRVRNALKRSTLGTLTNPVTNLPEGVLVDERLTECLDRSDWSILKVSLVNLMRFRELYGFIAADDVIRAINLMIHNAVREIGKANDFIGHLNPDEIIVVTTPQNLPGLAERIQTRLEQTLEYFYPLKDREWVDQQENRLAVHLFQLNARQGTFSSLQDLKEKLAH